METKWTEAIHKTPQPEPGVLTERALAQAPQKSRRTLRPYAYGSLALAATLPLAFFALKKASSEAPTTNTESPTIVTPISTIAKARPTTVTQRPMTASARPTTAHSAPTTAHSAPTTAHSAPTTAHSAPTTAHSAPTTAHSAPTTVLQRPMTATVFDKASSLSQGGRDDLTILPLAYNLPADPTNPIHWNLSFFGDSSLPRYLELSRHTEELSRHFEVARAVREGTPGTSLQAGLTPRVAIVLPGDPPDKLLHPLQESAKALQAQRGGIAFQLSLQGPVGVPSHGPSTLSARFGLDRLPTTHLVVASVTAEPDGSLVLLPPPCPSPMEEILKNPKLRDYTQVKLTPAVVAALKAKGITDFVGKSVLASGKSETSLYLSRPAFEVTTVTVEKTEDIAITPSAPTRFLVATATPEANGALVLRAQPSQYALEEVRKNPKLRDYTQVKLTPSVVATLKARGFTEFVGMAIEATGKSETSIYLAFPAFEGTTVTVERPEDILIGIPFQQGQAQDVLRRLREAKDGQGRYPLLISPEFNEALFAAAERGDEATVIELVQWSWFGGPQEATKGGNGVTWAAYCPTAEPVKALLERGVPAGVPDASGNTGLHRTYRGEIAELLLKHKAPTEIKNTDGETPLVAQARQADRWLGRLGVVQALLAAGANPNATDNQGRTPLMWAAKSGLPDFVEALLKKGADTKYKDKAGKTARDYTAAWQWGTAPGLLTVEGAAQLQRDAEADRARVEQLLGGR
jgi:Ankyrin repeats (many copies)